MKAALPLVLLGLIAIGAPGRARAQDGDPATRARALFAEGVELAGQQQYAEAAERFRQALALRDAPAIRYNLASTLYEEHQYTEAYELTAGVLADAATPEAIRTPATALQQQIAAAAALVTFTLPWGVTGDVSVDDVPVADPAQPTAVAPGRHTVRAVSAGATVAQATFELGSGVRREVPLETVSASGSSGPEGPVTEQWWFWAAVGGGVVVLGVVIGVAAGVADHDAHAPIAGNFTPGIISW